MSQLKADPNTDLCKVLVESYAVNERMNQLILEHLDPAAWRSQLPNSKGRTIAAIFTHVHNIRRKWLRLSAPHLKLPATLNRATATQKQTQASLLESAARCSEMLASALSKSPNRIETFHRDGWAKPWPAGPAMLAYMITHDAHHRGQVSMLAHQLGYPLPPKAAEGIWGWKNYGKTAASLIHARLSPTLDRHQGTIDIDPIQICHFDRNETATSRHYRYRIPANLSFRPERDGFFVPRSGETRCYRSPQSNERSTALAKSSKVVSFLQI